MIKRKKYGWPAVMEKKRRERRWFGRMARGRDKKTREGEKMGASWFLIPIFENPFPNVWLQSTLGKY
jgi:hypothetical protein